MSMLNIRARRIRGAVLSLAVFALAASGRAGQTRNWAQAEFADFEKGISHNISLRSDGMLTLAPRFQERYDTSATYLWSLAQDSKGNLYAGGGPGAKLYRLTPKGEKKVLAELEGLEIHALALDKSDRIYAATSPDGKVYRMAPGGKPEVFYDPKAKYIWAIAFNREGDLLVATGDRGELHRVSPDGKGGVFFKSDETHARSMTVDGSDNVILGTEPGGLVIRVSPSGQGFVLYQMAKREVTAVAAAKDGSVWAAAVGDKLPSAPLLPNAPLPPAPPAAGPAAAAAARPATPTPASMAPGPVSVTGGSEVYRIDSAGNPHKMWTHAQDIVYSMAFDAAGHALLGTGNKGYIYRIDSPTLFTLLLNGSSTQITDLYSGRDGRLYAATGNIGKIYEIGPGLEAEGTLESDVHDAGVFSQWGRLSFEGEANSGQIRLMARSGNLDQPQKNWSPWSTPVTDSRGARVACPAARFVQWKATLAAGPKGHSPSLVTVDLAYLPKNMEPRIDDVEITPSNYKFPAPSSAPAPSQTITLPPLTRRPSRTAPSLTLDTGTPALTYSKGVMGVRWSASDENGDTLVYTVEIRGAAESRWKPLKDALRDRYFSWDATAFPDGEYNVRIIASDAPANPPGEALTAQAESVAFLIDNTPPAISGLAATWAGSGLKVRWKAVDALTNVSKAEYSIDGGEWTVAPPVGGLSDSLELDYDLTIANVPAGEHTIAVRVEDEYDNRSTGKTVVK